MLPADISADTELLSLFDHRDSASVSIYLGSSPVPADHEAVKISLRNAIRDATHELVAGGTDEKRAAAVLAPVRDLLEDHEFWRHQSRSLAIFAAPDQIHAFRLANTLHDSVAVGDRFDAGPVLRAVAFPNRGWVLGLSQGSVRLWEIGADGAPVETALDGLPDDLHTVLETTTTDGRFDRHRAQGTTGDRVERDKYCRIVDEQVVRRIRSSGLPLLLAATDELDPSYRSVNSYDHLLEARVPAHPESLPVDTLDRAAREALDAHYGAELDRWREQFGTQRSDGRATSSLAEVSRAASTAAVAELLFDIDAVGEGEIDEHGEITESAEAGPSTYAIVDEIAARVLRAGGSVRAVRNEDLIDGSPVAAILRYPLAS